jgi:sterol desaturase/sphingolipid hydroxylase (fatty acid hydroxylase superfamily)
VVLLQCKNVILKIIIVPVGGAMDHPKINYSKEPVRLFKSDFLEFFTHISPITIIIVWIPIALFFLLQAITTSDGKSWAIIPQGFLVGLFIWTFTEYMLHRFLFHYKPKTPTQEKIFFLFHGVHHAQPHIKTRLVMPLPVSIPLALVTYGLFYLVFDTLLNAPVWMYAAFFGFMIGYLIYDLNHYATHHLPMKKGYFKFIKRYHLMHHYQDPNSRFGVSSPLWDYVFKTKPD